MKKLLLITSFFTFISANSFATEVAFIGVDNNGKEVITHVEGKKFQKQFNRFINNVNTSTLDSLNNYVLEGKTWKMNRFEVGLGLKAAFGLGNVLKASATPTVKLVFMR